MTLVPFGPFRSRFHLSIFDIVHTPFQPSYHFLVAMGSIPVYRQNSTTLDWEVVSSYDSDDCENRSDGIPVVPDGGALRLYDGSHQHQRHGHVAHSYRDHPVDPRFAQGEQPVEGPSFVVSRLSPYPPPGTIVPTTIVTVPSVDTYNKMQESMHRGRRSPHPGPVMPELHSPLPTPPLPPPPPYIHTPRPSRMSTPVPVPTPILHPPHAERYREGTPVPPMRYCEYSPIPDGTGYPSRTSPVHEVADHHHHYSETRSYYPSEDRALYHNAQHGSRYSSSSSYQRRSRSGDRASSSSSRCTSRSPARVPPHAQVGNHNMLAVPIQTAYGW